MISKISVSNFGSIRDRLELDFRIPGTTPLQPNFRLVPSTPAIRLPKVIALFGANGAGKTTILKVIAHTLEFVLNSDRQRRSTVLYPFHSNVAFRRNTRIRIEFAGVGLASEDDTQVNLYRYEVEQSRTRNDPHSPTIVHEALFWFPRGRPRRVFERKVSEPIYITPEAEISSEDRAIKALRPDASLIATLAASHVPMFVRMREQLSTIYTLPESWRPDTQTTINNYAGNTAILPLISRQLQRIDVGIESMNLERLSDNKPELAFSHHGLDGPLAIQQESAGTRNFVGHFPFLNHALGTGNVVLIDALDAEFHADLASEVVHWFQSKETNPHGAQLICTLHNLAVLESLEKEEIVIVRKNREGVTRAYGLWQVRGLRRTANLFREYRSGDLGGLPVIG